MKRRTVPVRVLGRSGMNSGRLDPRRGLRAEGGELGDPTASLDEDGELDPVWRAQQPGFVKFQAVLLRAARMRTSWPT
jgi:hypothetical protein